MINQIKSKPQDLLVNTSSGSHALYIAGQSCGHGGFGGLRTPKKAPSSRKWNTINQWSFCQIWMSSPRVRL